MDIERINKKHFSQTDMFYRIAKGLSSRLLNYRNEVFYLEITIDRKWNKDYNTTASEIAHVWKKSHHELSSALGCKVYIRNISKPQEHTGSDIQFYTAKKGIIFKRYHMN